MKTFLMLASLLPAALAAQQETLSAEQLQARGEELLNMQVAKHQFSSMQDVITASHGIGNKADAKTAIIKGKKMTKLGKVNFSHRPDLSKKFRANAEDTHKVVVAVKQRNVEKLEKILYDVSDPKSANYGKHWTKEQMTKFTANPASTSFVKKFFEKRGATVVSETANGEYVTFEAPVKVWEEVFQAQFYELQQSNKPTRKILRAEEAFLPQALPGHVQHVFNVIDLPDAVPVVTQSITAAKRDRANKLAQKRSKVEIQASDTIPGMVTPALLNSYYKITSNTGNPATTQAVYESLNQSYSPTDLSAFQTRFNLPQEAVAADIGGHVFNNACVADGGNNCLEANLDVQYMMAVAQSVPMTYYYDEDWMLGFVKSVAEMADPPKVISISYGGGEAQSPSYFQTFDTEAMKLGIMGVTLVASSGDDGVASFLARDRPIACGYRPSFPASSPYVTAVGGTFGPEDGTSEVACTSNAGGVITTGGGFSDMYGTPSWQQAQVTNYFNQVKGTNVAPAPGYNANGRGYPDVSALAASYAVMAAGNLTSVYGTSASSPVVAGMVALVNSARITAGKSNLGWINPSIYQYQNDIILNDIVIGENNCVAGHSDAVCCSQGFYATTGWDPVSGIGSLDFTKFQTTFLALGNTPNAPTAAPTVTPGSPTNQPVAAPTVQPSAAPTAAPTTASGWMTYTVYSQEGCTGTANVVSGTPTNKCMLTYSTEEPYNVVGSQMYVCSSDNTFATIASYEDQACTLNPSYTKLFLGCNPEYTTSVGVKQSTQLTCAANTNVNPSNLPLPETSSDAVYSTHLSYNQKSNACLDSELAGFTSFLNGVCFSEQASADVTYSFLFNYPLIETFNEAGCPSRSKTVSIVEQEACVANTGFDDDVAAVEAPAVNQKQGNLKKRAVQEKQDVSVQADDDEYYAGDDVSVSGVTRVYGRAVKSTVSTASTDSNSGSDDFFDNKPAVSIVFILVGAVATVLVGVIVYYSCFAKSSLKSPLLGNQA